MLFISEEIIEKSIAEISAEGFDHTAFIKEMEAEQPAIMAYFFSEGFNVLTSAEQEYLLFLVLVILKSVLNSGTESDIVSIEQVELAEESNWGILQDSGNGDFRDRITPFFESYPQEDLLAFVEDSLIDEEQDAVSNESREPMFIALKNYN